MDVFFGPTLLNQYLVDRLLLYASDMSQRNDSINQWSRAEFYIRRTYVNTKQGVINLVFDSAPPNPGKRLFGREAIVVAIVLA